MRRTVTVGPARRTVKQDLSPCLWVMRLLSAILLVSPLPTRVAGAAAFCWGLSEGVLSAIATRRWKRLVWEEAFRMMIRSIRDVDDHPEPGYRSDPRWHGGHLDVWTEGRTEAGVVMRLWCGRRTPGGRMRLRLTQTRYSDRSLLCAFTPSPMRRPAPEPFPPSSIPCVSDLTGGGGGECNWPRMRRSNSHRWCRVFRFGRMRGLCDPNGSHGTC